MAAAKLALSVARGEAVTFTGTHETSGSDTTPIDISGWTIRFTVKDDSGTVLLDQSVTVTSGPAGTYSFSVAHADTLTLDFATYPADLWRTDAGSEVLMGVGTFRVTTEVKY